MQKVRVSIRRLPHGEKLALPDYATPQSAGVDLRAAVQEDDPIVLAPGARTMVPTGFQIALPAGVEAQVRPRSGLAVKYGVTVLNSPGTIDADYRGEVHVILINLGSEPFVVRRGERIAQLVLASHLFGTFEAHDVLEATARGEGGFGSTGHE
jgi:dUTP pyrophosphatase